MRTAIVTNKIGSVGGVQTFSNDLANLLEERGHHVDLIGRESLGNYEGNNLEEAVGNFFNKANKLFPYDVVLCNGEFGYSVEHPKAINVFHGNYYGYAMSVRDLVPESVTRGRLEKAKLQKVSAKEKYVVSVSESSRNQLEAYGIPVDKVINNSVDTNLFFPIESPVEDHSISLARGMYYEKGFDILHRLGKMGIKIRVYSDLKIESLNLDERDFIDRGLLREEFGRSRLLISPSRFEGGNLTVLEAMASGCPIVTTPTGYGMDIGREISNFVAESYDEFFVKVSLVGDNREKYSRQAIEYFHAHHSPEKFRDEWISLIEGI